MFNLEQLILSGILATFPSRAGRCPTYLIAPAFQYPSPGQPPIFGSLDVGQRSVQRFHIWGIYMVALGKRIWNFPEVWILKFEVS